VKTAIIHYWLVGMRGGEKVLEQLCEMFPDADIYTHVYSPNEVSSAISRHKVQTTFIGRIPGARKHYKKMLSLMPRALESLDLSQYDLVISSESGPAKGVICRPDALHICYCHSPMRYIWDQQAQYFKQSGLATRIGMRLLLPAVRIWDVVSTARVDHFIANSTAVAQRIDKFWRRTSEVIPPPVNTQRFHPTGPRQDFYLYVGEFVPYKRAELAVEACNLLGRKLKVIGDGVMMNRLRSMAGPNVELLGRVPLKVLADHYAACRALLFPAEEDFGIVPVEAMSSGAPVIAYGRGGALDYVIPGENGLFFDEQTENSLASAIEAFEAVEADFDALKIAHMARRFDTAMFVQRMKRSILNQIALHPHMEPWWHELAARWNIDAPSPFDQDAPTALAYRRRLNSQNESHVARFPTRLRGASSEADRSAPAKTPEN
jgi:glycosyltransferase involved in cell wall biosynthesis